MALCLPGGRLRRAEHPELRKTHRFAALWGLFTYELYLERDVTRFTTGTGYERAEQQSPALMNSQAIPEMQTHAVPPAARVFAILSNSCPSI